ncbi:hypothetical protein BGX29_006505 [Mortierella sp. GBA35]|nr:hypothetical protein BGX29_006505 [Mortierella sp. GBA35]
MAKFQGIIYYSNMVFQKIYHWTPLQTSLGFLVHSLLSVLIFSGLGRILPRLPLKPLILIGFLLRCGTALMYSFVDKYVSYFAIPFPAFILHTFGMGLSLLPIQVTAVRDAENKDQGLVGALYSTGLQLGAPFGIAILNVISLSTNNSSERENGGPVLMMGFRNAFYAMVAMGLFAILLAWAILPWDKPVQPRGMNAASDDGEVGDGRGIDGLDEGDSEESTVGPLASAMSERTPTDAVRLPIGGEIECPASLANVRGLEKGRPSACR